MSIDAFDCMIIGGGPAGLCAATYLGRFRRKTVVIDGGESRVLRIPLARNVPGFPDGVAGKALHAMQIAQADRYGAGIVRGQATGIARAAKGFEITSDIGVYTARTVIMATGVKLVEPPIKELDRAIAEARIRYCPICDGFETQGKAIAVLGRHANAINEARFIRRYTDRVTFLCESEQARDDRDLAAEAEDEGVVVLQTLVRNLTLTAEGIEASFVDRSTRVYDALYPCLGAHPQTALIEKFSIELGASGAVRTDEHQRTNAQGIYAIGDVREGLDQIASAWGQAAIAATAIHNDLRQAENNALLGLKRGEALS